VPSELQPVRRPVEGEIIPISSYIPWREKRQLQREARAALFRERLNGAVKALRLLNARQLVEMQMDMHIELGNKLANALEASDNPLHRVALERSFEAWMQTSESIIASAAW
jgi:hypothetical protein